MRVKIIDKDNKNPKVFIDGVRLRRSNKVESSRPIFFSKEYVVKLEEFGTYLNQCSVEKKIWKKIEEKYRKYFVPTLKAGCQSGWEYVVQPKVDFKSVQVKNHDELDFLLEILEKYGLNDYEKGNNIGITKDNRILCYDYGV